MLSAGTPEGTNRGDKMKDIASSIKKPAALRKAKTLIFKTVIFLLMIGLAYVILFPFLVKLSSSLMSPDDLYDSSVSLIPKSFYLGNFRYILEQPNFMKSFFNTLIYASLVAVCTVVSSTLVGYGFARYKFRGNNICFALLIVTLLVPGLTISVPMYAKFRFFDIFGLFKFVLGERLNLTGSVVPLVLLSLSCLGFRGGIHAVLMRQYFKGVPNEIAEAARVDGAGHFKTFLTIMLPMARSIIVVVFVLAFAWQWSDTYFLDIIYTSKELFPNLVMILTSADTQASDYYIRIVYANAGALLAVIPPLIFFIIFQRKIIEGIERAGLVG